MPQESGKIRNVAVLGHRGSGKTSLVESLLFESGATTRLGSVADGTTVTDHDDDEKRRSMSISASLAHATWEGRRLNLIDTPGDPSFQGDALGALRVVEGAIFEISGVAGVEVSTDRLWRRADELGLPRLVHVNLLDRERADFDAALESLRPAVRLGRRGGDADGPGARLRRRHRPRPHEGLPRRGGRARGRRRRRSRRRTARRRSAATTS